MYPCIKTSFKRWKPAVASFLGQDPFSLTDLSFPQWLVPHPFRSFCYCPWSCPCWISFPLFAVDIHQTWTSPQINCCFSSLFHALRFSKFVIFESVSWFYSTIFAVTFLVLIHSIHCPFQHPNYLLWQLILAIYQLIELRSLLNCSPMETYWSLMQIRFWN